MIFTAAAIILYLFLFAGIGNLMPWASFRARYRGRYRDRPGLADLLSSFWIGWALALGILQLWHLIFPVGAAAFWLAVLASAAGWFRARNALAALGPKRLLLWSAAAAVSALALASHVFFVPPHYDHGLYHQQTVMWINQYAIVPGLGNLHHRLAFNNASFLYAALINAAPVAGRAYFTANTTLALAVIMQCAVGLYQLFERREAVPYSNLYYALMLPAALWHFSTTHLPGYSPDVVVFALQVVLGGLLLRLFEAYAQHAPETRALFVEIVLLAAAGTAVKLSFGIFGALAALSAAVLVILRRGEDGSRLKAWALPVGLAAALIVPWMARGVILSGYPLFPSTALSLPVAWRMPIEMVKPISPIILNWARTANSTIAYTADMDWLRRWYAAFPFSEVARAFTLGLAAAGLSAALWVSGRSRTDAKLPAAAGPLILALISGMSLAAWFLLAPDYRFSGALVWIFLAAALSLLAGLLVEHRIIHDPLRLAVVMVLGLAILISPNHFQIHKPGQQALAPVTEQEWVRQFADGLSAEKRTTQSGLEVYLPSAPNDQCFSLPLPCTRPQDYVASLRLIEPGSLQRGFTLRP